MGGIAAGFAIIWALAWRRQEAAVAAIEERDGARFYVDKTSPLAPSGSSARPGFGGDFLARLSFRFDLHGPARIEQRVDDEHRRGRPDIGEDLAVRLLRALIVGVGRQVGAGADDVVDGRAGLVERLGHDLPARRACS